MNTEALSSLLWLWIPILIIVAQVFIEILVPHPAIGIIHSENGPHEMLQFFVIFIACIVACRGIARVKMAQRKWMIAWMSLAALCCLYVAGEEISWGQHILEWATPEFWSNINDQNETNLHNTSSWLDQKPRLILLLGVVVGGLIIPLLQHLKVSWLPKTFEIIYPTAQLSITAALALGVKLIDKIDEQIPEVIIFARASEVEELYLFYFVLLYMIVLRRRVVQNQS